MARVPIEEHKDAEPVQDKDADGKEIVSPTGVRVAFREEESKPDAPHDILSDVIPNKSAVYEEKSLTKDRSHEEHVDDGNFVDGNGNKISKYEEFIVNGETFVRRTDAWKHFQDSRMDEIRLSDSGIPLHVLNLTLDDYYGQDRTNIDKLKMYIDYFDDKFRTVHLYFWSHANGTQKTTTASIVGRLLISKGKRVRFVLMGDLLKTLSDFGKDEIDDERIDDWKTCDFLIIDDSFDKKKATVYKSMYQISFLDQFLRKRMEIDRLATCFTSNFSIEEIDDTVFGISLRMLVARCVLDPFEFTVPYTMRNNFSPSELWSVGEEKNK